VIGGLGAGKGASSFYRYTGGLFSIQKTVLGVLSGCW